MTTQFLKDSLNTMETPYSTKDSREVLHDTSNATDAIKDWRTFWKDVLDEKKPETEIYSKDKLTEATTKQVTIAKQKTVDDFLDTLCCALEELNGEEVFNCFVEAVLAEHDQKQKEYYKITELFNLLLAAKKFKYVG